MNRTNSQRQDRITITRVDKARLQEVLERIVNERRPDMAHLRDLGEELERATLVEPDQIPADVVTMNSRVRLTDLADNEVYEYALVYPQDANAEAGRLSVLAPLGTALIGYRMGDVVEWPVPAGTRKIRIDAVLYQPEAAGQYQF